MANCIFCARAAGFLKRHHSTCRERHRRAAEIIPKLVEKCIATSIPVVRFHELLNEAAGASFISPSELKRIIAAALAQQVTTTLLQRLPSIEEDQRINEIIEIFELDLDGLLFDLLVKADMLRAFEVGETPDRVRVKGSMPIALAKNETIIWIFNRVAAHRKQNKYKIDSKRSEALSHYAARTPATSKLPSRWRNIKPKLSDFVVTNRNLYLLSKDEVPRRVAISRVVQLNQYKNGISIVSSRRDTEEIDTIRLDDPWFATNLVGSLIARIRTGRTL